eukprot:g796.t1
MDCVRRKPTNPLLQPIYAFLVLVILTIGEWYDVVVQLLQRMKKFLFANPGSEKKERGEKPKSLESVSIIFAQADLALGDLPKIIDTISWSLKIGFQYIFVYDPEGFLNKHFNGLSSNIQESNPDLLLNFKNGWGNEKCEKRVTVHVISGEDAMAPLLHVASEDTGTYQGLTNIDQYWSTSVTRGSLYEKIADQFGEAATKEPNAIVVIGPVFTLAGCPPFHARLAEIYYLGLLQDLTFDIFCSSLKKYWNTRQRFGK